MRIEQSSPPDITAELLQPAQAPVLTDGRFSFRERMRLWLPPDEVVDYPDEKFQTPVDEQGLIIVPELIELVQGVVDPQYRWSNNKKNHHFYWPSVNYPYDEEQGFKPSTFRNLRIHRAYLPTEFENLLHKITEPPEAPSLEVMEYRVEAWHVARNLFDSARSVVQWERRARRRADLVARDPSVIENNPEGDTYAQEYMADLIGKYFGSFEHHMSELEKVPAEFRFIEPTDSPQELAKGLGKLVVPSKKRAIHLVKNPPLDRLAA